MFTIRVTRDKYADKSVSGIVVDCELYAPRGEDIRTLSGLLVHVKYTTDTGLPYVWVTSTDEKQIFLSPLGGGDPRRELLLDFNRDHYIETWAKVV